MPEGLAPTVWRPGFHSRVADDAAGYGFSRQKPKSSFGYRSRQRWTHGSCQPCRSRLLPTPVASVVPVGLEGDVLLAARPAGWTRVAASLLDRDSRGLLLVVSVQCQVVLIFMANVALPGGYI